MVKGKRGDKTNQRIRNSILDLHLQIKKENKKKTREELGEDERFEDHPHADRDKDIGDGGEQKCIMHQSQVYYATMDQCRADIIKSELLIEGAIFDNFGEEPIDHQIMAGCFEGA